MTLRITTPPSETPVSLAECKTQMKIDADLTAEDTLITALIEAAVVFAQRRLRRQLCAATGIMLLPRFPADGLIVVDSPPLSGITSIVYLDSAGDQQTLATDQYTVDTSSRPGRILRPYGVAWPATYTAHNAVTITADVGYGAAADVPQDYRLAIKYLVAHWHATREPMITGTIVSNVPMTVEALLANRDFRF